MLSIAVLDTETAPLYSQLTFPRFRERLLSLPSYPDLVAVGAALSGRPTGLALGNIGEDRAAAWANSVYVLPRHRGAGIGTRLLERLEEALRERGCLSVEASYQSGRPSTAAVERLLEKRGWEQPRLQDIVFLLDGARLLSGAGWLRTLGELPPGFSFFPWRELDEDTRRAIAEQRDWIPDFVVPHANLTFEPASSIGLRYQGEIVGWYIHRHLNAEIVTVEAWVRPDLRRVGRSFLLAALIREAVGRVLRYTGYKYGRVTPSWPPMVTFSKRHLTPWCASVTETRHSRKALLV